MSGSSGGYENLAYDVIGLKLPNGKIQIVKNKFGNVNENLSSEEEFQEKFGHLNESVGASCVIMETING